MKEDLAAFFTGCLAAMGACSVSPVLAKNSEWIANIDVASLVVFSLTMPAFADEGGKTMNPKKAKKFPQKTEEGKTKKTQSTKTKPELSGCPTLQDYAINASMRSPN